MKIQEEKVCFTPGPWTPQDNCEAGGINHFAVTAEGPDWMICSITPMRLKRGQDEANARLIAAAPDLLDACKAMLQKYVTLVNCGDCGNWDPETEAEVIALRAAIAKASQP